MNSLRFWHTFSPYSITHKLLVLAFRLGCFLFSLFLNNSSSHICLYILFISPLSSILSLYINHLNILFSILVTTSFQTYHTYTSQRSHFHCVNLTFMIALPVHIHASPAFLYGRPDHCPVWSNKYLLVMTCNVPGIVNCVSLSHSFNFTF